MMAAVAQLGTLAFARTPLPELTEVARTSAAEALDCPVRVDENLSLFAERELTDAETDFLTALGHVLGGAQLGLHRDPLTGLPNRVLFEDRTAGALARLRRGAWRVALLCVDLDRLKVLNEALGHQTGDAILRAAGPRLEEVLRPGDTVARYGGGFAILCEGIADEGHAARIAARVLGAFLQPFEVEGVRRRVSASVGVAVGSAGTQSSTLIADAEAAMYRAKERGRGRLELHDPKLRARVAARARMEDDLRRALEDEQLWVAYQPIHRAGGGIAGVEALVRWDHPELGAIPPSEFIPIAEECGLIVELGAWILRTACRTVARWRTFAPTLGLSVNLSARQVTEPGIANTVAQTLVDTALPAEALWLELTEGLLLEDSSIDTLRALRADGARLVLDDFGTGYSSLSYLRRYPIDVLKIDRSFIADEPILAAIAGMAHALGLDTVAEGVESEEQLEGVTALSCDYVQGYHLSRPLPAEQLEALLHVGSPV